LRSPESWVDVVVDSFNRSSAPAEEQRITRAVNASVRVRNGFIFFSFSF
jgi:predicted alpha-1,6-mannanase (GH76 family)